MYCFISKFYQSIIAKDQMVKAFFTRYSEFYKVNPAISGYEDFDNQAAALGESRAYRKLTIKTEFLYKKYSKIVEEKFFYSNYVTRDLVPSRISDFTQLLKQSLNLLIALTYVLVIELRKQTFERPPPIKYSLIQDINLISRLLPAPIPQSA